MSVVNADGMNISYESSELIEDLKMDILECGGNKKVAVWCKNISGVTIYTNYDFIVEDNPISASELKDGEFLVEMTMSELLPLLEKQNSMF